MHGGCAWASPSLAACNHIPGAPKSSVYAHPYPNPFLVLQESEGLLSQLSQAAEGH